VPELTSTHLRFTFANGLPIWQLLLIGLLLLTFLGYQIWYLRQKAATWVAFAVTGLRLLAFALIVVFLTNPTMLLQTLQKIPIPLAVLLDSSESMSFPAASGSAENRLHQGQDVLLKGNRQVLEALTRDFDVRLYRFDEHARAVTRDELASLTADGRATNLIQSLTEVQQEYSDTPLAGLVVLSDGIVTAGESPVDAMRHGGTPVVTIGLGDPESYRDIQIAAIEAPNFRLCTAPWRSRSRLRAGGIRGRLSRWS